MATRRKAVLWTAVGSILAGSILVLGILHASAPDPEKIKADFAPKLAALEAMTVQDAVRRDAIAEELLAVEDYAKHARSLYLKLERLHPRLHEEAQRDRRAQKEVPPFLARCRDFEKLSFEDLQICAGDGRSLLGNYSSTRFGAPLQEAQDRLQQRIDALRKIKEEKGPLESLFLDLYRKVRFAVDAGRFDEALELIAAFEKQKPGPAFTSKIQELREAVERGRLRQR